MAVIKKVVSHNSKPLHDIYRHYSAGLEGGVASTMSLPEFQKFVKVRNSTSINILEYWI